MQHNLKLTITIYLFYLYTSKIYKLSSELNKTPDDHTLNLLQTNHVLTNRSLAGSLITDEDLDFPSVVTPFIVNGDGPSIP